MKSPALLGDSVSSSGGATGSSSVVDLLELMSCNVPRPCDRNDKSVVRVVLWLLGADQNVSGAPREKSFKNAKTRKRSGLTRPRVRRIFALPRQGLRSAPGGADRPASAGSEARRQPKGGLQVRRGLGLGEPAGKAERPDWHPGGASVPTGSVRSSAQRARWETSCSLG